MKDDAIIDPKTVVLNYAESQGIAVNEIGVEKLVVVSWLPHIVDKLRVRFNARKAENWLYKNNAIYLADEITIGHIRPGAPAAAIYIEQLIAAGAERIITVGYAGSLTGSVSIGDVIVPNSFISTEGTSRHYCKSVNEIKPTEKILKKIQRLPSSDKFKFGKCWSTDALFRETEEDIKCFSEQEALCVDMESSACAAVCNFRNIEVCNFLLISDSVHSGSWVKGFSNEKLFSSIHDVVETMVEMA